MNYGIYRPRRLLRAWWRFQWAWNHFLSKLMFKHLSFDVTPQLDKDGTVSAGHHTVYFKAETAPEDDSDRETE